MRPGHVAEIHGGDQAPDELLLLHEQERPRLKAPDQEAAEQHRGGGRARDAERQHGQERRGAGGVRCGFGRQHALDLPLPEIGAPAREALGDAVAHEGGGDGAARRHAHPHPDDRRAQQRRPVAGKARPGLEHHLQVDGGLLALEVQPLLDGEQDLGDAEQADHHDEEVEAAHQLGPAEGHAQVARDGVEADGGEQEADGERGHDLGLVLLPQAHEGAEGEKEHGEELGRAEAQREPRHQRRHEGDEEDAGERADEGGREGGGERFRRPALHGHRDSRRRWSPPTRLLRGY